MDYAHIKKYVIPGIIFCLIVIFGVYFVATHSTTTNAPQLAASNANEANVYTGVENASTSAVTPQYTPRPQPVPQDALTAIRALPNTSTFVSLVERTGVLAELSKDGTYTFFVPTNAAFAASPVFGLSLADQKRLAEYHIIEGQKISVDSVKFGHVVTLSRDLLNNNVLDGTSVSGNSHILGTYSVPNGIVYLVDIVLLPPQQIPFKN